MDQLTASIWRFLIATLAAGIFGTISLAIVFGGNDDPAPASPIGYDTASETTRQLDVVVATEPVEYVDPEPVTCAGRTCVPRYSPDGYLATDVWEDGSAGYGDSAYYFDAEGRSFEHLRQEAPAPSEQAGESRQDERASTGATDAPQEDDPSWSCMRNGNRICGPSSGPEPGCYRNGELVIPWTRYDLDEYGNPSRDPLWAQLEAPC